MAEQSGSGVWVQVPLQALGLLPAYLQSLPPDLADDLPSFRDKFVLDNLLQLRQHVARNHGLMEADHIPAKFSHKQPQQSESEPPFC